MKKLSTLAAALLAATALTGLPAFAQEHEHNKDHEHHVNGDANEYENTKVSGVIRKIDLENNKVTIKHEEIKKYGMGGMTMNFRLKSPKQLDGFQAADKIRFIPYKVDGGYVLRSIEKTE